MDFPATYTKDKKWNSCVRRRKWIRYRRYKSRDTWAKVFVPKYGMGAEHGMWHGRSMGCSMEVLDRRPARIGILIPQGEGNTIPTLGPGL